MNYMDYKLLCRICLSKCNLCANIYEGQFSDENPIYQVINYVYDLEITLADGLPKYVCRECLGIIKQFRMYKTNAHTAKRELLFLREINNTETQENGNDSLQEIKKEMEDCSNAKNDQVIQKRSINFCDENSNPQIFNGLHDANYTGINYAEYHSSENMYDKNDLDIKVELEEASMTLADSQVQEYDSEAKGSSREESNIVGSCRNNAENSLMSIRCPVMSSQTAVCAEGSEVVGNVTEGVQGHLKEPCVAIESCTSGQTVDNSVDHVTETGNQNRLIESRVNLSLALCKKNNLISKDSVIGGTRNAKIVFQKNDTKITETVTLRVEHGDGCNQKNFQRHLSSTDQMMKHSELPTATSPLQDAGMLSCTEKVGVQGKVEESKKISSVSVGHQMEEVGSHPFPSELKETKRAAAIGRIGVTRQRIKSHGKGDWSKAEKVKEINEEPSDKVFLQNGNPSSSKSLCTPMNGRGKSRINSRTLRNRNIAEKEISLDAVEIDKVRMSPKRYHLKIKSKKSCSTAISSKPVTEILGDGASTSKNNNPLQKKSYLNKMKGVTIDKIHRSVMKRQEKLKFLAARRKMHLRKVSRVQKKRRTNASPEPVSEFAITQSGYSLRNRVFHEVTSSTLSASSPGNSEKDVDSQQRKPISPCPTIKSNKNQETVLDSAQKPSIDTPVGLNKLRKNPQKKKREGMPPKGGKESRTRGVKKTLQCNLCNYSTSESYNLKVHIRKHTGEKPYKCNECDYSCSNKSYITVHLRKHTGQMPLKCNMCDFSTNYLASLKTHLRKHTGEKPFKCNVCVYSTYDHSSLRVHLRKHTGEKPFKCNLCDFSSARKSHLTVHLRRHTGEKPFKCNLCDYSSAKSFTAKRHMHTHKKDTN